MPQWWDGGQTVKAGETFSPRRLDTPLDKMLRHHAGRRSRTHTDRKRGRYIQSRPAPGKTYDLAFDATLRAAAPFQTPADRTAQAGGLCRPLARTYMRKVRVRRAANLVLFLVDASWSMAVAERMAATKGAILSLLTDAYQRRDRVGLIVFQKDRATLVLPPTNSVHAGPARPDRHPGGRQDPAGSRAADGLRCAAAREDPAPGCEAAADRADRWGGQCLDGQSAAPWKKPTSWPSGSPQENIHCVVVNMEHAAFDQGLAQVLADHLEAECLSLSELKADSLYRTVRKEMDQLHTGGQIWTYPCPLHIGPIPQPLP